MVRYDMKEFIEKLIIMLEKDNRIGRKSFEVVIENINQLTEELTNHTNTKIKTKADKIRNMSDEELANFLINFRNTFGEEYEGEMSCLDYLKSEC